ncbi:MAG: hypothetical protein H0U69_03570 [Trueperaceae bacterium]|nr:hypothetical protein [Trueperaceae bacterium]
MDITPATTLSQARRYVEVERFTGVHCPCCDAFVKVYRRKITNSQVRFLRDLYQLARQAVPSFHAGTGIGVDVRQITGQHMRGGDYSKLRHWELIEDHSDIEGASGYWAITAKGKAFLLGQIEVPKYAWVLRDAPVTYSDETISVHDAWGFAFDVGELMV